MLQKHAKALAVQCGKRPADVWGVIEAVAQERQHAAAAQLFEREGGWWKGRRQNSKGRKEEQNKEAAEAVTTRWFWFQLGFKQQGHKRM